jgi:MFS family permease
MKFFGWRMVFTGLTLEFTVVGFLFYSFPVIWPYLISELGMTESQLGMVSAFYFIPVAILAIIIGRALDKYSVKNFMMIGSNNLCRWTFLFKFHKFLLVSSDDLSYYSCLGIYYDGKFSRS